MLFRRLLMYAKFQAEQVKAMAKPKVVFVLGGPGAGKGTQCEKIVKEFGYVHLSAGELLRIERRTEGSQFGSLIEGHMRDGTIVPVAITCSLLEKAMMETMKQDISKDRFLIDGFPRNRDNLDGWNKQMGDKASVQFVLFFDCDEQTCIDRCVSRGMSGSGRSDDNLESTKKRIVTYNESTRPIIEHYDSLGLVRKVKSTNTVDEVFADVKKVFQAVTTD